VFLIHIYYNQKKKKKAHKNSDQAMLITSDKKKKKKFRSTPNFTKQAAKVTKKLCWLSPLLRFICWLLMSHKKRFNNITVNHMKLTVYILRNLTLWYQQINHFMTTISSISSQNHLIRVLFAITNLHQKHTVKTAREKRT